MSHYLHIEGMDLSGKTTAANNFSDSSSLEWQINANSLGHDNSIWQLADKLRKADEYDSEIVGNLYVTALMADIRSFEPITCNTIQDSTIALRSLAYHTVAGTPRLADTLQELIKEHPKFDASFYLLADIDAREERLQKRIIDHPEEVAPDDILVLKDSDRFIAMERCLRKWSKLIFKSVEIDTTKLTPDQVISELRGHYSPEQG
jgi:thymidylate kinase